MMYKSIVIFIVILCFAFSFAQEINIKVNNLVGEKASLSFLSGEMITFIDSINTVEKGEFQLSLIGNHPGIYRITFNNKSWIDFIYDREEVYIETNAKNVLDSLKVIESESNRIFYSFIKSNKNYKTKTELLQIILARYPKDDKYYQMTKEKFIQVQEDYLYFVNVTSQSNPNSFIARYVRTAQLPVIETDIPFDEQLAYLKTHALDNINFYDEELIYSDVFTNKSIEYLTYYRNPQLPLELLEKEFMLAVDTIITKAKVNSIVYQHITEYLIDGFKKFGFDNIIDYIVDNYVIKDDLCLDKKLGNTIERRIKYARNFKIGNKVPNITIPDSSGSIIELNKINADKTLILFYASWCPHCKSLLPQVHELYKKQQGNKFKVLAISIDTSRMDWIQFARTNNLDWINTSNLKGWNGKTATDYFIYATPTMLLVDKNKYLIAKPSSVDELSDWF